MFMHAYSYIILDHALYKLAIISVALFVWLISAAQFINVYNLQTTNCLCMQYIHHLLYVYMLISLCGRQLNGLVY